MGSAQTALDTVNKSLLFGQEVRVNWAFQKEEKEEVAHHFHAFVGDLSSGGWELRACTASGVVGAKGMQSQRRGVSAGGMRLVGGMAGWLDGWRALACKVECRH